MRYLLAVPQLAKLYRRLPELGNLERVLKNLQGIAQINVETVIRRKEFEFPIYSGQ